VLLSVLFAVLTRPDRLQSQICTNGSTNADCIVIGQVLVVRIPTEFMYVYLKHRVFYYYYSNLLPSLVIADDIHSTYY
jgi:hypothetical protein